MKVVEESYVGGLKGYIAWMRMMSDGVEYSQEEKAFLGRIFGEGDPRRILSKTLTHTNQILQCSEPSHCRDWPGRVQNRARIGELGSMAGSLIANFGLTFQHTFLSYLPANDRARSDV